MRNFLFPFFFLLLFSAASAQSLDRTVYSTAGDYFVSNVGSYSVSIGQDIAETAIFNSSISLSQGFQQAQRKITLVNDLGIGQILVSVFPNPASENLTVSISGNHSLSGKIEILNLIGGQEGEYRVKSTKENLDISSLAEGIYFLRISLQENEKKFISIQKVTIIK